MHCTKSWGCYAGSINQYILFFPTIMYLHECTRNAELSPQANVKYDCTRISLTRKQLQSIRYYINIHIYVCVCVCVWL